MQCHAEYVLRYYILHLLLCVEAPRGRRASFFRRVRRGHHLDGLNALLVVRLQVGWHAPRADQVAALDGRDGAGVHQRRLVRPSERPEGATTRRRRRCDLARGGVHCAFARRGAAVESRAVGGLGAAPSASSAAPSASTSPPTL